MTGTLTAEEELHWLALTMVPGLGTRKASQLIERYRTPEAVFRASSSELEGFGLSGSIARSIAGGCAFEDAVDQQQKAREQGVAVIPIADARYPPRLREIYDPPVVLFARGRMELLQSAMLGVVGTRRPTPYGSAVADKLSGDLALAGMTITSGMARGIDTAAHRSALGAGGDTVAVFGCGVDLVYPAENRKLAAELAEKGLLVSEFPMGAPAYPQNFPIRNRIISGMSVGVLVVEGAQYSGSAITARLALDQQREVFAVPGSILSKMSWGPNLLIKQGAKLVQDWNDVLEELPEAVRRELARRGRERLLPGLDGDDSAAEDGAAGKVSPELTKTSRDVLGRLQIDKPTHTDELLETLEGCSSSEIIAALFDLEMLGLIRQLPGRNFVKVW
ncbi:MAG: DNA-processing protein DprA [Bryobacteraceae bacterium]